MAPFFLIRQWMRLYGSTEGQRLLWLCSPILEWQSLWHPLHMDDEGSCIEDALFLFFCLLVVSAMALFSSRIASPSYTPVAKHHDRLPPPPTSPRPWPFPLGSAYTHHCNGEKAILSCHHLSVQYVLGDERRPVWPSQRSMRCERIAYMLGILACRRTSWTTTCIKTQPLWQR